MAVLLLQPYWQFFDSNGDPLNGGFVYTYEAGTLTPKATYTDYTENTSLDNPIELDSAGRVVAWGTGSYKFIVKDALGNTIETTDNVSVFSTDSGGVIPVVDAGGTVDAITANYSPDVSIADKLLVSIVSAGANTVTNPTFSPDGNTARTIVRWGGQALAVGDTGSAGMVLLLQYDLDNTRWELLNPKNLYTVPTGTVLSTSVAQKTDTFSSTSTSFVDITGLTLAVTPASASDKVLVRAVVNFGNSTSAMTTAFRLTRDGTAIGVGTSPGNRIPAGGWEEGISATQAATRQIVLEWLDSPATTSSTTYAVQMLVTAGTGYVNRSATDTDSSSFYRMASQLTLQEIKG
jgi:hypothetical protein